MTFLQFAFKNVTRNKRLYAAYFLSSLFMVMVFFTFANFAFHPELTGNKMNVTVTKGMNISGGIIYVFSFFFILYSMSSFLHSRKKEFGLLMIQGMSMKQIRTMVFLENMMLGAMATISGIIIGLVFAKGILLLAKNVLILDNKLNFYFPLKAILLSVGSFLVLFFFISLFVSYILRSKKLIDLIKGNKKSKGEPKSHAFLTFLAIILLIGGYAVALIAKGVLVVTVMLPVIIVVTIGTYLLFTQLSVFLIQRLKKNEHFFWNKTNMLLFSDLSFRMKDNARTFFMVAMVSTVAFSAIGTLFGFQTYLTSGTKITNPNTLTYRSYDEVPNQQDIALIDKTLQDEKIKTDKENIILTYFEMGENRILVAKESDYNRFAKLIKEDEVDVNNGEVLMVEFDGFPTGQTDELQNETLELQSGVVLKPNETISSRALPETDPYYLVSDDDFAELPAPTDQTHFYAWQATSGEEKVIDASEKLYEELEPYEITSVQYEEYLIKKSYGSILFVGLFIGLVFFVSAGSFLYFRLYMDLDEDKQKFTAISKMGLTEKELTKVLSRQIMLLFYVPILVALIHGAVALTALSHLFDYNLVKESAIVLSIFFLIQVVYFFTVRFFYTRQIKAEIL